MKSRHVRFTQLEWGIDQWLLDHPAVSAECAGIMLAILGWTGINWSGLFQISVGRLCAVTRVSHDTLMGHIGTLEAEGFLRFDRAESIVWVVHYAERHLSGPTDGKTKVATDAIRSLTHSSLWGDFWVAQNDRMGLDRAGLRAPHGSSVNHVGSGGPTPSPMPGPQAPDPGTGAPPPPPTQAPRGESYSRELEGEGECAETRTPAHSTGLVHGAKPEHRWSATVAEDAIRRYCEIVEKSGRYPVGDPDQAFERAALYLRDTMNWPEDDIGPVLLRIVELAAKDQEFRKHPKHGDLFLKVEFLVGSKVGRTAFGADVKLPEWINKLAADKPKLAAPRPPPQPEPTPEETEATMTAAQLRKRADDAVTSSLRLPKGDKFETMLLARAERCRKRADELDAAGAINATTAN